MTKHNRRIPCPAYVRVGTTGDTGDFIECMLGRGHASPHRCSTFRAIDMESTSGVTVSTTTTTTYQWPK